MSAACSPETPEPTPAPSPSPAALPGPAPATLAERWSAADRKRVAVLAETFVPGGAERRADLAVAALEAALPAGQIRQLRLALRLLDSRSLNALLVGRAAPLAALSQADRERLLRKWSTSRVAMMRAGFQAWKRLLLFIAYATPVDETGAANPLWPRIEYAPDRPPVTSSPSPIEPIRPPALAPGAADPWELDADVAIVGSGAGGSVLAAELAKAGRSVIVLEAGPFVAEPEMPTDELTAIDRLYMDHGLCATSDGAVSILAGATVGGGTVVNWTTCIPVPPDVREEWARDHGVRGIDGPETEADLAVLERELAICPPAVLPPKDETIIRGAQAIGYEAAPTNRNAESCTDCGSCGFGCRRGAKRSMLRAHLADAWSHGARVVPDARVTHVLVDEGRATGVGAIVGERRLVVHARQVVVAGGALRTPVVLARSGIAHPAVGKYLRLHPVAALAARFDTPVETWRGPLQAARSVQFLGSGKRGRGFIVESAPAHPGLDALSFPWSSAADHAAMMARARYSGPLIAICRDRGSGTVKPAGNGGARIDYTVAQGDRDTLRRGLVEMAKIARGAGAVEIVALGTPPESLDLTHATEFDAFLATLSRFDFSPNRGIVFSAHQMGSARMGDRAADHVCDPDGRVRANGRGGLVRNLYVADASLFPTAIGVNPMITVMLLARRVSRTVLAEG